MKTNVLDTRDPQEQEADLMLLDILQEVLEEQISAYALVNPENLYDTENEVIIRKMEFSRGLKHHLIVLTPDRFIRAISKGFPSSLLLEIHNNLIGLDIQEDDEESLPQENQ